MPFLALLCRLRGKNNGWLMSTYMFLEKSLVGVMTVNIWDEDTTGKTAYYTAAYVMPRFRHTEVSKTLNKMLDLWAIERGCDKAIYTIKPSNTRWLAGQIKNGSLIKKQEMIGFADGTESPTYWLERKLVAPPILKVG